MTPLLVLGSSRLVYCCSVAKSRLTLCNLGVATPWSAPRQTSLSFTISQNLLKLMSIESMMPSNHLILCCPVLYLPSIFPSIRSFPMSWPLVSGGQSIGVSASASVLPVNIQAWFPLRVVFFLLSKGLFESLLHHHNSKASVLWHLAFFMVQLSHLYLTTGKTRALTVQTFIGKVMSLLLNMLSRFVIAFLPRSKCLLNSWPQSLSAMILEPKKMNSITVSTFSPSICHEWWDWIPWS